MFSFFSPSNVFSIIEKLIKFINSIFFIILAIGLTFALIISPPDYLQGDSVRIMYVHVPSSWIGLSCYLTIAILSTLNFIFKIKEAGSKKFIIHARRAILSKLSPKQNLTVPPLNYEFVYRLKNEFNQEEVVINGGITNIANINVHLKKVDGVMIGRTVYHSPYFLAEVEKEIFNNNDIPSRQEVMENLMPYIEDQTSKGVQLNHIMRHTVGLFHGQNGSKAWKQYLSKNMCIRNADLQKVNHIMDHIKNNNQVLLER